VDAVVVAAGYPTPTGLDGNGVMIAVAVIWQFILRGVYVAIA
jgi:hypothetical protein